jgi:hypothetical protein
MHGFMLAASLFLGVWGQPYNLHVQLQTGDSRSLALCSELSEVEVGGTPAGVTGSMQAQVEVKVLGVDAQARTYRLKITCQKAEATFNGVEQTPPQTPPTVLEIDERGRLVKLESEGPPLSLETIAAGGVPVALLVLPALVARFPNEPVEVGQEWEREEEQPTPLGAVATVKSKSKLLAVSEGMAKLSTEITATFPPFRAPNPLQPGLEMTITDAQLKATELTQVVELSSGLVREAMGRLAIALVADLQGVQFPAQAKLDLAGAEKPEKARELLATLRGAGTPAAPQPQQPATERQASGGQGQGRSPQPQQRARDAEWQEALRQLMRPLAEELWNDAWRGLEYLRAMLEALARELGTDLSAPLGRLGQQAARGLSA